MRKNFRKSSGKILAFAAGIFFILASVPLYAADLEIKAELFKQLKYRHIGPVGNRVIAVVGVPGNANICYAGAASGGIFKSVDQLETDFRQATRLIGRIFGDSPI